MVWVKALNLYNDYVFHASRMAKNPFVDGITNLAIPDAAHGVSLKHHQVPGNLFGIEAVVKGDADLRDMQVKGNAYLRDMQV